MNNLSDHFTDNQFTLSATGGISDVGSNGPKKARSDLSCSNCRTTVTPLWRRGPQGTYLCNACGLYFKIHGTHRSMSRKSGKKNSSVINKSRGSRSSVGNSKITPTFPSSVYNTQTSCIISSGLRLEIGDVVVFSFESPDNTIIDGTGFIRAFGPSASQQTVQVTWLNLKDDARDKSTGHDSQDFNIGISDPNFYPVHQISKHLQINMLKSVAYSPPPDSHELSWLNQSLPGSSRFEIRGSNFSLDQNSISPVMLDHNASIPTFSVQNSTPVMNCLDEHSHVLLDDLSFLDSFSNPSSTPIHHLPKEEYSEVVQAVSNSKQEGIVFTDFYSTKEENSTNAFL